jgi:hypothetical protein
LVYIHLLTINLATVWVRDSDLTQKPLRKLRDEDNVPLLHRLYSWNFLEDMQNCHSFK